MKSKENLGCTRSPAAVDLAKFSLGGRNYRADNSGAVREHTNSIRLNALASVAASQSNKKYSHIPFPRDNISSMPPISGQHIPVGPFQLQLGPNITSHPFVNASFTIPLFLYDGNRELVQGYEIPIVAELFYHQTESSLVSADDICTLNPSQVVIGPLGVVEIQCCFSQLSMQHSNRRFVWKFSLRNSILQHHFTISQDNSTKNNFLIEDNINHDSTISIMTPAFLVVRQRLKISVSSGCNTQLAQAAEVLAAGNNPNHNTTNNIPSDDWIQSPTIQTILNNSSNGHIIWYKDEGGKDHGLDVTVTLIDAKSEHLATSSSQQSHEHSNDEKEYKPVLGHEIPFVFQLVYSNGDSILGCSALPLSKSLVSSSNTGNSSASSNATNNTVINAGNSTLSNASASTLNMMALSASSNALFSILPDGNACFIDKTTGKTTPRLKIRIHDISKNHQRQLFRLKVMPDIAQCPGLFDVAGDESMPIEVRSKRTKRQRDALILLMQQQQQKLSLSRSPSMISIHHNTNNITTNNTDCVLHQIPTVTVPDELDSEQQEKSRLSPLVESSPSHPSSALEESSTSKKRLISDISVDHINANQNNVTDEGVRDTHHHAVGSNSKKSRTSNMSTAKTICSPLLEQSRAPSSGENTLMNDALARWIQQTVQTLHHIRWQPIGYQTLPDGSIDSRNLLYHMTNPNEYLNVLLEQYEHHIHPLMQQHHHVAAIADDNSSHPGVDNNNRNSSSFMQPPTNSQPHAIHNNANNNNNNNIHSHSSSSKVRTKKFGRVGRDIPSSQSTPHIYPHPISTNATSTGLLADNLPVLPYFAANASLPPSSQPLPSTVHHSHHPLSSSYMHHTYHPISSLSSTTSSMATPSFLYPYGDARFHVNNPPISHFHPPPSSTTHHPQWQNISDMSYPPTYSIPQSNSTPTSYSNNHKNLKSKNNSKRESNNYINNHNNLYDINRGKVESTTKVTQNTISNYNNNSFSTEVFHAPSCSNNSSEESRVFTIVSSPLRLLSAYAQNHLNSTNEDLNDAFLHSLLDIEALQIPAFDTRKQLVGFYSETKDENTSATILQFIPLSESIYVQFAIHHNRIVNSTDVLDYVRQEADRFFEEMSLSHTEDVFSLSRTGDYDLENMKQDAMVHFWFAAVGLSDEF